MTSHNGFIWPKEGPVYAPDWNPEPVCGGGLHGLLMGEGDSNLLNWSLDAFWLVVEVISEEIVDLAGKIKFQSGNVIFCGNRYDAAIMLISLGGDPAKIPCTQLTGGDHSTLTGGDHSTLTGGYHSTLIFIQKKETVVVRVGQNGIKPNVKYRINNGKLVEV